MMKRWIKQGVVMVCVLAMLTGCGQQGNTAGTEGNAGHGTTDAAEKKVFEGATVIELSDEEITVDGNAVTEDCTQAVYVANDIIFYLEGQGFTYGEGTETDEHSQEEADAHTVVYITKPGTYAVSGQLSAGQIAIDLGEDAEENPEAVVNLILNGVDITCTVAPAVIFYNVYECGVAEAEGASKDVDTTAAGANVLIADGTVNNVTGSYVARIYKSYTLNEGGTEVVDNKKLHKYDAAFYSKMSMNVNGDELGTGVLNITAENEGLDSELHLTINGGNIHIKSGNDGINTNEDEVSVTTVNGGTLTIQVTGETGEGDGIDSNGWLVINGGTVIAEACSFSGDAGIDSDMGIHINGGMVIATGNMLDTISESDQNFVVFSFASRQNGGETYTLKNETGEVVFACTPENDFTYLILSSEKLTAGTYTLWCGEKQLAAGTGGMMGGFPGGRMPEGMELPEGVEVPEGFPGGERLEGMEIPKGAESPEAMEKLNEFPNGRIPEGMEPPKGMEKPEGDRGGFGGRGDRGQGGFGAMDNAELSTEIIIVDGGNYFNNVSLAE
ncbi:MAG: carbohydrate-binding domain-containing protein [Lachnospiraceae bacterium]|nr:carbohydrate-binding domain-containing protein [Lachnospiraceae bacterium]